MATMATTATTATTTTTTTTSTMSAATTVSPRRGISFYFILYLLIPFLL
jgi:hypothetical protein